MKILRQGCFYCCLLMAVSWSSGAQDFTVFPREDYYQSQPEERRFSTSHWMEVTEGIDYSESVRGERIEDENFFTDGENRDPSRRSYDQNTEQGAAFWAMLLKFFIIAGGLAIVALIISRFLGPAGLGKPRSRRFENSNLELSLQNIEDNIHESDLQRFIREALAEKNFNLAIRLYYLTIIKELSLNKMIRWKRDKTNRSYIQELYDQPFGAEFRSLTLIFERVWYGYHQLEEAEFLRLQPRFEQLITTCQQAGAAAETPSRS